MSQQWLPTVDPASGKTYYFNPVTRQTSWTLPGAAAPPPPPPSMPATRWQEGIDPKTGKKYYMDHVTQTTTWERPQGVPIAPAAASPSTSGFSQQQPAGPMPAGSVYNAYYQQPSAQPRPGVSTYAPQQSYPQPQQTYPQPQASYAPPQQSVYAPQQGYGAPQQPAMGQSMMNGMPFSSSRAAWQNPLPGDVGACPACGAQLQGMFKTKRECKCCNRTYCDACSSKKAVVLSQGSKPIPVCPTCFGHLNRAEQRCLCRIVPYLGVPDMSVRTKALDELNGLTTSGGYTPADFFAASVPRELKSFIAAEPQYAALSASILAFCVQYPKCVEYIIADESYVKELVLCAQRHIEENPNVSRFIVELLSRSPASCTALHKAQILPALQKGLTASNTEIVVQSLRALGALYASGASGNVEDEATIILALVPILDNGNPDIRSSTIGAIKSLLKNPPNRLAFISCDGVQTLGRLMPSCPDNAKRDILDIFFFFAEQDDTIDCLSQFIGIICESVAHPVPEVQQAATKVLSKMCNSERMKRVATEALLLEHCAVLNGLIKSSTPDNQQAGVSLVLMCLKANIEIAPPALLQNGVISALAGLARSGSPERVNAITCLAMSCGREPKVGNEIADPTVCGAVIEMAYNKNKEVVTALWALTANPEIAALCVAHQHTIPLIMMLLSSGDNSFVAAACYIISNLCSVREFPGQILSNNIIQHLATVLNTNIPELQIPALSAVASLSNDPSGGSQLGINPVVQNILPTLMKAPSAELCFRACNTAATLCNASSSFRVQFCQNKGLSAAIGLTSSSDAHVSERATFILYTYASKNDADRGALSSQNGIDALLEMLFSNNVEAKMHAVNALRFYAQARDPAIKHICEAGGIVSLTGMLSSDNPPEVIGPTAETLLAFITVDEKCRMSAYDASVLSMMVKVLQDSQNEALTRVALAVIDCLLNIPEAAAQFAQDSMILIPQLLGNPNTKDAALQLINRMSSSSSGVLETYIELSGMNVLIGLLATENADLQFRASELVARFSALPGKRQELLNAECMPAIKALLEQTSNERARMNAVRAVSAMSEDPIAQDVILSSGTLDALLKLIQNPSDEIRNSVVTVLSHMSTSPEVLSKMSNPEIITVFARCLSQTSDSSVAPSIIHLLTLTVRNNPEMCEIVERESLVPLIKQQLFIPDNTSETMDLLFEIITRRPACSKVVLDPENIKAVSLIFALVEPGGALCQQSVAILYAVSVNCAEQFSAAASSFSFDIEPFLAIASQQSADQQQSVMSQQALSILSALSKSPRHRQLLAQSSLSGTLLSVLISSGDGNAKAAALSFASELSGSEAFRKKACSSITEWLRVFTEAISNDKPAAQVVQAEKALLRLSVMEAMRAQVSSNGSELTRALATVANCEAADRQESAALAITVLCAFDLLDISAYSALIRSVFSRQAPCYQVKNSLTQAISSLGCKELFNVFAIPSSSISSVPPAPVLAPPPPPPMEEAPEAPKDDALAATVSEDPIEQTPPPPPPPEVMPVNCAAVHIDVELLSLFCKGVADAMLHVGEMCPSFFHAAFGVLYALSKSDEARSQIRTDVTPESLGLFSDAVAGFSFDALRLADVVGSL